MTTLESRNFVATEQDVAAITRSYLTAINSQIQARSTYLRALVATVQAEFKMDAPVKRVVADETVAAAVKILDAVHERFYATVISVAAETDVDDGLKGSKADRLHRRAVFARTAASTLRRWIRAGHDVRVLKAATVSKTSLQVARREREARAETTPVKRALALGEQIAGIGEAIAGEDKAAAIHAIEAVMDRLAQALMDLGGRATTRADVALKGHRPFRTAEGIFWPVPALEMPP